MREPQRSVPAPRLRGLRPADRAGLAALLCDLHVAGWFTPEEVDLALELIDVALSDDDQGYAFVVAEIPAGGAIAPEAERPRGIGSLAGGVSSSDAGRGAPRPRVTSATLPTQDCGRVAGYACFGIAPLTDGVYDLYWIAVDPALHGRSIGQAILQEVERRVRDAGGRMVLLETAGKPSYAATRAFYERAGYIEIARIPDFYRVGDDKIVYARRVFR